MKCLGLHNKPTAKVHPGHMLTGPKEEEEEEEEEEGCFVTADQVAACWSFGLHFLCVYLVSTCAASSKM
jgi:hypothetical protein